MLTLLIKLSSLGKYFVLRVLSVWCSLHHHFWGDVLIDLHLSSCFVINVNKILATCVLSFGYYVPLNVFKSTQAGTATSKFRRE